LFHNRSDLNSNLKSNLIDYALAFKNTYSILSTWIELLVIISVV